MWANKNEISFNSQHIKCYCLSFSRRFRRFSMIIFERRMAHRTKTYSKLYIYIYILALINGTQHYVVASAVSPSTEEAHTWPLNFSKKYDEDWRTHDFPKILWMIDRTLSHRIWPAWSIRSILFECLFLSNNARFRSIISFCCCRCYSPIFHWLRYIKLEFFSLCVIFSFVNVMVEESD